MLANAVGATADLHCHSSASGPNGNWWYAQVGLADCNTPPAEVYEQAKARRMTFVTLTDHDSIDGALELCHLPDFIVGEEVTVYFPDDGTRIDVVVLGLDRQQHIELQARRDDAYALVRYLREQRLVHFLAHPVYDPANALEPEHLARLAALFSLWETRNGARLPEANALAARLLPDADSQRRFAAELGLEPPPGRPAAVGGSDDHGGTDIGTTYTLTPPAASKEQFLDHLRAGRCRPAGLHAEPARMTHMMLRLLDRHRGESDDCDRAEAWRAVAAGRVEHRAIARVAEALAVQRGVDDEIRLPFADPNGIGNELAKVRRYLRGQGRLLPYLVVQAYLARERQAARRLASRFDDSEPEHPLAVALLADGLTSVNGVAEAYREILPELDRRVAVTPITCGNARAFGGIEIARADTLKLPIYPELDLPLPHLSELAERVFDIAADVIHVTGPGPMGIAGLAAAKLLRLPLVASYHTELGDYARALTGDPLLAELSNGATVCFYAAADLIVAPSETTAARLPELLGVPAERVVIVPQAVDGERFSPVHRTSGLYPAAAGRPIVLCVARLSREKGLDRLLAAANALASRDDFHLVIVGDGPARTELEAAAGGYVTFTGWLEGYSLSQAFACADLFVLPSATETCGQVLLEAQASGLPCVVSPLGAASDTIKPGVTGLVAAKHDADGFAAAITALLDDSARRAAMGRAARTHAISLSWSAAANALAEAYTLAAKRTRRDHPAARTDHLAALG